MDLISIFLNEVLKYVKKKYPKIESAEFEAPHAKCLGLRAGAKIVKVAVFTRDEPRYAGDTDVATAGMVVAEVSNWHWHTTPSLASDSANIIGNISDPAVSPGLIGIAVVHLLDGPTPE